MTPQPICYHLDKTKALKGTLAFLAFLLVGLALVAHPSSRYTEAKQLITILFVVLPSALLVLIGINLLLKREPGVEITESGLRWNISILSGGFVAWGQIKSAACINYRSVWFVNLELHDMQAFINQQSFWRKLVFKALVKFKWPVSPASVPATGLLGATASIIAKEINHRVNASNNQRQPMPSARLL